MKPRDFMTGRYQSLGDGPISRFSVVMPAELKERLRAEARKRGVDCSTLARLILSEALHAC